MSNRRIGIYGGTFDPIHFGHLNLAVQLKEKRQLDEVWLLPNRKNPHKADGPLISPEHRLKMVELAVAGIPEFKVLTLEIERKGPSYTVDSLQQIILRESKQVQFYLLIGDDVLPTLHKWHEPQKLVDLVPLIIGKRQCKGNCLSAEAGPKLQQAVAAGMTDTTVMEISATEVRRRLRSKQQCRHLVPTAVISYIQKNNLYEWNEQ